jgi:hypothetical protein
LEEEAAPVDGVGERASDERDADERKQGAEAEQPDRQGRVGELEDLVRNRDEAELSAEDGNRLSDPEPPEGPRLAQRTEVQLRAAEVP